MRIGDIYVNKWAGLNNPTRVFFVTFVNHAFVGCIFENGGRLCSGEFRMNSFDSDHFVKIGHMDLCEQLISRLQEEKRVFHE